MPQSSSSCHSLLARAQQIARRQRHGARVVHAALPQRNFVMPRDPAHRRQEENALVIQPAGHLVRVHLLLLKRQLARNPRFGAQPRHRQKLLIPHALDQLHLLPLEGAFLAEMPLVAQLSQVEMVKNDRLQQRERDRKRDQPQYAHARVSRPASSVGTAASSMASFTASTDASVLPYTPRTTTRCASTGIARCFTSSGVTKSRP